MLKQPVISLERAVYIKPLGTQKRQIYVFIKKCFVKFCFHNLFRLWFLDHKPNKLASVYTTLQRVLNKLLCNKFCFGYLFQSSRKFQSISKSYLNRAKGFQPQVRRQAKSNKIYQRSKKMYKGQNTAHQKIKEKPGGFWNQLQVNTNLKWQLVLMCFQD